MKKNDRTSLVTQDDGVTSQVAALTEAVLSVGRCKNLLLANLNSPQSGMGRSPSPSIFFISGFDMWK